MKKLLLVAQCAELLALSAWVGGDLANPDTDISLFLHWFAEAASQHMLNKDMDFVAEVRRKRIKFGLQTHAQMIEPLLYSSRGFV